MEGRNIETKVKEKKTFEQGERERRRKGEGRGTFVRSKYDLLFSN